jgi:hypothetical protein
MGPEHCRCAELADVFPDTNIQGMSIVAGFVDEENAVECDTAIHYRCLDCGQWWRDGFCDDQTLRKVDGPDA